MQKSKRVNKWLVATPAIIFVLVYVFIFTGTWNGSLLLNYLPAQISNSRNSQISSSKSDPFSAECPPDHEGDCESSSTNGSDNQGTGNTNNSSGGGTGSGTNDQGSGDTNSSESTNGSGDGTNNGMTFVSCEQFQVSGHRELLWEPLYRNSDGVTGVVIDNDQGWPSKSACEDAHRPLDNTNKGDEDVGDEDSSPAASCDGRVVVRCQQYQRAINEPLMWFPVYLENGVERADIYHDQGYYTKSECESANHANPNCSSSGGSSTNGSGDHSTGSTSNSSATNPVANAIRSVLRAINPLNWFKQK